MLQNIATIFIAFIVILLAVNYNWLYEYYIILGFNRPPIKPYGNGKCRKIEGIEACEDIHIHHRTGRAFMTCGTEYERTRAYWPPLNTFNSSHQTRDTPYIYDIDNDKLIPLVLENFPPEEDFATHGLGIYEDPEDENKLYMFFINHKRSGSCIETFEHTLNTNELIHLETIQHELIKTPNDIVPVSRYEFYFTNDHYFTKLPWKKFERPARLPWSNVVFHSSITNETKIAADGISSPNGINTNWDRSLIYVTALSDGSILIYERNKNNNDLKLRNRIFTGYVSDNISVDEVTGEIYITIVQKPLINLVFGKGHTSVGVLKISNNTEENGVNYSQKVIFEDDGTLFHSPSTAAVDRKRNVLLISSYRAKGIVRCDSLEP
ncbi:hypothetical protein C1645_767147 [Glomus cerebriforme]|uniref:Calcium-dependent phosphotriesterase n=1 Tax=Glomus cerebriforme TaxID=658196 RepID=A0A397T2K3_9GLOM|nr:hypothetical protein C1645_767147 [Glomus cerebriforme]